MPLGLEVIVPLPDLLTESVKVCTLNVAVTDLAASIVTVHVPVPEQPAPLQPTKVEPTAGLAVRVTLTPWVKEATQVLPQLMPARLLVTVPLLPPEVTLLTERVDEVGLLTAGPDNMPVAGSVTVVVPSDASK